MDKSPQSQVPSLVTLWQTKCMGEKMTDCKRKMERHAQKCYLSYSPKPGTVIPKAMAETVRGCVSVCVSPCLLIAVCFVSFAWLRCWRHPQIHQDVPGYLRTDLIRFRSKWKRNSRQPFSSKTTKTKLAPWNLSLFPFQKPPSATGGRFERRPGLDGCYQGNKEESKGGKNLPQSGHGIVVRIDHVPPNRNPSGSSRSGWDQKWFHVFVPLQTSSDLIRIT